MTYQVTRHAFVVYISNQSADLVVMTSRVKQALELVFSYCDVEVERARIPLPEQFAPAKAMLDDTLAKIHRGEFPLEEDVTTHLEVSRGTSGTELLCGAEFIDASYSENPDDVTCADCRRLIIDGKHEREVE